MEQDRAKTVADPPDDAVDAAEKRRRDFERSLAGPSVGKAGLMRDQTDINRIIAEASKGSKFYNNQVRKDESAFVLTQKIAWFQAKRDELLVSANVSRLEAEAERILAEVEQTRDLTQTIVHVDMDAFYASVEVQRDPSLKGKAFGVGRGVLTTASYEARKFGCRSGMAGFIAKKLCSHIILTELHFDLYIEASKAVREVLLQYDENLMMASLDEGYLNITPYMTAHDMTAKAVVEQMRAQVEEKTKLTMSAGIAPNRTLAKICSDKNKPNGQFELDFDRAAITRFMRDLPVRKIPGLGRVAERCLEGLGVETCGDIWTKRVDLLVMDHWFGFRSLCKSYLGIAPNTVAPGKRGERKSVGVERTFRDKTDNEEIMATLEDIAMELGKDLEKLQYAGKTVTVKYKLHTYENKTRAHSVKKFISTPEEILPIAQELLRRELPLRIRLLGIRLSTLKDLTVPDKGIKTFFTAKAKVDSPSERGTPDITDLTAIDDDDEDDENEWTQEDFMPEQGVLGKRKSASPAAASGPLCPICSEALPAGASNQALNDHIDMCLNRDAIEAAGGRIEGSKVTKKAKKATTSTNATKGTMLGWLQKKD